MIGRPVLAVTRGLDAGVWGQTDPKAARPQGGQAAQGGRKAAGLTAISLF